MPGQLKLKIMNRKKLVVLFISLIAAISGCNDKTDYNRISLIPQPVQMKVDKGNFKVTPNTSIDFQDKNLEFLAIYASTLWEQYLGFPLNIEKSEVSNTILFKINKDFDTTIGEEGYILDIKPYQISLSANTFAGIFYGIQTIYQLISTNQDGNVPCLNIVDYPRFGYRGMHLDVSRHFMPIDFIYKVIDYMATHKLNVFHWHLVDDQGWRLEIKKYPKLTEVGAWRVDLSDKHWDSRSYTEAKSGPATYGGFYTQEEVRELVVYAAKRNITIMPEIEMPAHVMSALAAYPEYSCTGENLGVPPGGVWPITHIYCAGNDATFKFLEDVLIEVMDLFPSKLIHIGGDEADKTEWKKCPKCQKRIKDEGLKDEDELQSYFIKRIEKFLNEHGRSLVGWDEILEGGLAQNATVMSWRGEEGGIEAARQGNTVIMTPGSHCYFNHYQGDPSIEPLAGGGPTTLKKVYHYEPIPPVLTDEQGKLILGAQANLWSEFLVTPKHVEYMAFPRLAALSEVLWSPTQHRNWGNFSRRMEAQYKRYDDLGINYSRSAFQVSAKPSLNIKNKSIKIELTTEVFEPEIRYTLDGSEPLSSSPLYTKPIEIFESSCIKAASFIDGQSSGQVLSREFIIHKAFASEITLEYPNSPKYDGHGQYSLVNGVVGTTNFHDGNWKGFLGDDLVATIDLGTAKSINSIKVNAMQNYASWIFYPREAIFYSSTDGEQFEILGKVTNQISPYEGGKLIQTFAIEQKKDNVRYIKVNLRNLGVCPAGHSGEGEPAWLFVDEIVVE
jgi:hexosaminidase